MTTSCIQSIEKKSLRERTNDVGDTFSSSLLPLVQKHNMGAPLCMHALGPLLLRPHAQRQRNMLQHAGVSMVNKPVTRRGSQTVQLVLLCWLVQARHADLRLVRFPELIRPLLRPGSPLLRRCTPAGLRILNVRATPRSPQTIQ